MGNKGTKEEREVPVEESEEEDEEGHESDAEEGGHSKSEEAEPVLSIVVMHTMSNQTQAELKFNVSAKMKLGELKKDISNQVNIPVDQMMLTRGSESQELLSNQLSLRTLNFDDGTILKVEARN